MTTTETKPIHHPAPTENPPSTQAKGLRILLSLRVTQSNLPLHESIEKYGVWRVKLLRNVMIRGKCAAKGDSADAPGNDAVSLVIDGSALFDDPKAEREAEILAEAAKIKAGLPIQQMAEFSGRPQTSECK